MPVASAASRWWRSARRTRRVARWRSRRRRCKPARPGRPAHGGGDRARGRARRWVLAGLGRRSIARCTGAVARRTRPRWLPRSRSRRSWPEMSPSASPRATAPVLIGWRTVGSTVVVTVEVAGEHATAAARPVTDGPPAPRRLGGWHHPIRSRPAVPRGATTSDATEVTDGHVDDTVVADPTGPDEARSMPARRGADVEAPHRASHGLHRRHAGADGGRASRSSSRPPPGRRVTRVVRRVSSGPSSRSRCSSGP